MERTRPSSTSASIASHVSLMDGLSASPTHPVTTGQWIRYRSRYLSLRSLRVFSHATRTRSGAWSVFQSLLVTNTSRRESL